MQDFMTDRDLKPTKIDEKATVKFEVIETLEAGYRFRVSGRNADGQWGGDGYSMEFLYPWSYPAKKEVIKFYVANGSTPIYSVVMQIPLSY